jgi:hypothetical protein
MKTIKQYQASHHKLQLQLALAAVFLHLAGGLDGRAAAAVTDPQNPPPGGLGPSGYPPPWASTNRSGSPSLFASIGGGRTNLDGGFLAGPVPRPANQRLVLAEVGPNHRSWRVEADAPGGAVSNRFGLTRRSGGQPVVALETGMNYWDGQQWTPSEASFELTEEAFVADRVQHRTRLNADLNVVGAVTTTLVDGTTLRSTPLAIGLYDPNNGRFAVLATLTNSVGMLVATNQVVYSNAFQGSVCGNVVYTLRKGSFHQDVVITGRLNPLDYAFPTNAQIQILTEFYDPPQPETMRRPIYVEPNAAVRARMVSPDLVDEVLGFSDLVMGTGRAFTAPSATNTNGAQVLVAKEFRTVPAEGRTFLIETVSCPLIQKALNALPDCGKGPGIGQLIRPGGAQEGYAHVPRPGQGAQAKAKPRRPAAEVAQAGVVASPGVVIDYVEELGGSLSGTIVFRADTTYVVEGTVSCNGPVTLEAAVLKYKSGTTIKLNNSLTCKTSSYRPAVFTCIDDDSIGECLASVDGYNGVINPAGYANPALWSYLQSAPSVCNVRFCYAQEAVRVEGAYVSGTVANAQFLNCVRGIMLVSAAGGCGSGSGSGLSLTVNNALMSLVASPLLTRVQSGSSPGVTASAYLNHCTVDQAQVLANYSSPSASFPVVFTNSILANVGSLGNAAFGSSAYNGFYSCPVFGNATYRWNSGSSPFQSSGGGGYYLKADSVFRGKGTTIGLPATLLPALKTKATQPPIAFPSFMEVTGEMTLFPQVPRYTSGPPDLGYYYDALDFTVAAMIINGGTITVEPGTAIGCRQESASGHTWPWGWTEIGIEIRKDSKLTSYGTPGQPVVFGDVQLVQEVAAWPIYSLLLTDQVFLWGRIGPDDPSKAPPILDCRFSRFFISSENYHLLSGGSDTYAVTWSPVASISFRDCDFFSGWLGVYKEMCGDYALGNLTCVNNLFDRVKLVVDPDWLDWDPPEQLVDFGVEMRNNLFREGGLRLVPSASAGVPWEVKDNLFDNEEFLQGTTLAINHDYNAYWPLTVFQWGGTARLAPAGSDDRVLASAPAYQTGPLGDFYLPTSSPLYDTANRGSRSVADAGLYHYTTRVDQTKDGDQTGNVIIGRHYVATVGSTSTVPKDYDTDGIPDYVENWHGDGDSDGMGGRLHADTETSWTNAWTVAGVYDPTNSVYDDVDLAGDGVVGRIKKALHPANPQPLVPDNSLALTPVTVVGADPRTLTFRISLDYSTVSSIGKLQLLADSSAVALATAEAGSGLCLLTWNTAFAAPGYHLLSARLVLNGIYDTSAGYDPTVLEARGPLIASPVNNLLQFEPLFCQYNTSAGAILRALLPEAQATYSIELQTPAGGHVRWLTSNAYTDTGEITETWDLKDDSGYPYAGDSAKAVFTVTLLASERSGAESVLLFPSDADPADTVRPDNTIGAVTVAYAYNDGTPQEDIDFVVQLAIVDQLIAPCNNTFCYDHPYNSYFNSVNWPLGTGNSGYLPDQASVEPLLYNLSNLASWPNPVTKNFIFLGHGAPNRIGGKDSPDISYRDVATRLGNYNFTFNYPTPPLQRYRFVFLAGCQTAKDHDWAHVFGVEDTITTGDLLINPNAVQAFVGWDNLAYPPFSFILFRQGYRASFLYECNAWNLFFDMWQSGFTLDECISYTEGDRPPPPFDFDDLSKWNFAKYQAWAANGCRTPPPHLRVWGYCGITRTGFAPGYDYSKHLHN